MPTVDLKWVLILSMILSVLGFLGGAGGEFADLGLSAGEVKAIVAGVALLGGCGNAINSVLVAFGMTNAGRLASVQQVPLPQKLDSLLINNPQVQKIETTPEIADATISEKVISNGVPK